MNYLLIIIIIILILLILFVNIKKDKKEGFNWTYPAPICNTDVNGKVFCRSRYLYPHYNPIRPNFDVYYVPGQPYYWRRAPYNRPLFRLF